MDILSYILGKKSSSGGGTDLSDYFTSTIDSNGFSAMIKKIPDNITVVGTDLTNAFRNFKGTEIPLFDTSSVTNMVSMFSGCINLTTIPLLNTSNVTKTTSMFNGCISLISVPLLDLSNVLTNNANNMFSGCTNLTTIPILNTSGLTFMTNMFSDCPSLTDISLDNLLQMCINSGITLSTRKQLSSVGLTSDNYPVSRIEALPHYQDFIDAGWTIGY